MPKAKNKSEYTGHACFPIHMGVLIISNILYRPKEGQHDASCAKVRRARAHQISDDLQPPIDTSGPRWGLSEALGPKHALQHHAQSLWASRNAFDGQNSASR